MRKKIGIILILMFFISCLPQLPFRGYTPFIWYFLAPDENQDNQFIEIKGELDTFFNGTGYILQDIGLGSDFGRSLAIQSDGKILLGGECRDGGSYKFCIARFLPNGTLDTSFNGTGYTLQDVGTGDDYGRSLAIQSDGKILLGGHCSDGSTKFCIARFK